MCFCWMYFRDTGRMYRAQFIIIVISQARDVNKRTVQHGK